MGKKQANMLQMISNCIPDNDSIFSNMLKWSNSRNLQKEIHDATPR